MDKTFALATIALSAAGACAVMLLSLLFACHKKKAVDRFVVKLAVAISGVNLGKSVVLGLTVCGVESCGVTGFLSMLLDHMYMLLNVTLAWNLYRLVLERKTPAAHVGVWWASAVMGVPLLCDGLLFGKPSSGVG